MHSEEIERSPRGASTLAQLPARLMEWEKNLRKCVDEGREAPSDGSKRLALLRMLPPNERKMLQGTANQLFPTFADLMSKVQELIQDDLDSRSGAQKMDVDEVVGDEG